jgi:hypothetical protein
MPLFRLIAIGQLALLARHHLQRLDPSERRRLAQLVRRGPRMAAPERAELRSLVGKLDLGAFAGAGLDAFSPVPIPRRFRGGRR